MWLPGGQCLKCSCSHVDGPQIWTVPTSDGHYVIQAAAWNTYLPISHILQLTQIRFRFHKELLGKTNLKIFNQLKRFVYITTRNKVFTVSIIRHNSIEICNSEIYITDGRDRCTPLSRRGQGLVLINLTSACFVGARLSTTLNFGF